MAPNRKKKKAVGNPARGFATVSLPSKSKEITESPGDSEHTGDSKRAPVNVANQTSSQDVTTDVEATEIKDMTPEQLEAHLEETELQILVETHAARCKNDATRQVAKLENERRHLRSQSHKLFTSSWLPDEGVDEILQRKPFSLQKLSDPTVNFADTDLLLRVWTLKIALTEVHMPDVDAAIKELLVRPPPKKFSNSADFIWGLQETLEWYAINRWHDINNYDDFSTSSPGDASPIESVPADSVSDVTQTQSNAHVLPPTVEPQLPNEPDKEDESETETMSSLSPTDSDDDDPSSLTKRYLCLQTFLFKTDSRLNRTGKNSSKLQARKMRLQRRIQSIRRDILFSSDDADAIWEVTLHELKIDESRSAKPQRKERKATKPAYTNESEPQEDDDILVGMFNGDEESSDNHLETTEASVVQIIDFGKWTGILPRRIMEECCRNYDARCKIKFSTLASTLHSTRQRIELTWSISTNVDSHALSAIPSGLSCISTTKTLRIDMDTKAAANPAQAESYLSTLVILLLIHSNHAEQKQVHRLPTVWRDVYAEQSQLRQSHVYLADRDCLISLRKLITEAEMIRETHAQTPIAASTKVPVTSGVPTRAIRDTAHLAPEDVMAQWSARSTSPAYQSILRAREQLPVHKYKDMLLGQIESNQLLIICADTGAGKSTQVPAFVLEHEFARGHDRRILVTQPRRISAISLARRVSQELGEQRNDIGTDRSLVGYAIRLESKTSKMTRLTYATSGVLLRMIEASPRLEELDYLILDEVHERTMDVDLLFIALRRLLRVRADLKVILMSATIDAQKFSSYFDNAPIVEVPGRTFPVETKYLEDAVEATLSIASSGSANKHDTEMNDSETSDGPDTTVVVSQEYSRATRSKIAEMDQYRIDYDLVAALAEAIATKPEYMKYSSAILIFMPGIAEIRRLHNTLLSRNIFATEWVIHLLHSSFSTEDLEQAFSAPPRGWRKIVIATNIAETGITIPDVTAVIDTCKEKVMRFDERRQLSRLTEGFISRSSARQRRGRAARVQDGICFHLVTRHRFETSMLEQHVPEMLRLGLQDPILRVKVWNLGSIEETLASAIDPPNGKNVRRAIDKLKEAGALTTTEELTGLGRKIAHLPLDVVMSKLAIFGIVFQCLDAVLTIVASLSSKSPFLSDKGGHQADARLPFARADSDLISTLNAYQGWRKAKAAGQGYQFCRKHRLHDQTLSSIEDQKIQLLVYLVDANLIHLSHEERSSLNRARTSSNRKTFFSSPDRYNVNEHDAVLSCVIAMAFYPRILLREGKGWRNVYSNQLVNLVAGSVVRAADKLPKWLCFHEAMQTKSGSLNVVETSKIPEMVIATILGSAEIRFFSGVMILDNGKVRFSIRQWKEAAAIKILRESLSDSLGRCWRGHGLTVAPSDQWWIDMFTKLLMGKVTKPT